MSRLGFIPPQVPSLTDQPPGAADWIHEVKYDGYRTMLLVERGTARAYTRNGHDWSDRYPGIIAIPRAGTWAIVATAGPDWGCFLLTLR